MPRYAYVSGRYVPHTDAAVHIEDRGFQFADGVYEVVSIHKGHLVDEAGHLDRLERSLGELQIQQPMSRRALMLVMRELIRRNRVTTGLIYMQITRGVAPRDFKFPKGVSPTVVMTTRRIPKAPSSRLDPNEGVSVITIPDIRWKRRDIKTVALLPQALGKQKATEAGAFEGWQVDDDGFVTEGCSSNAWIVSKDGVLVTRPASNDILNGITRRSILAIAAREGYKVEERPFTVAEALEAKEAFLTSATTYVTPITRIDGASIANGHPGALSDALRSHYVAFAESDRAEQYINS